MVESNESWDTAKAREPGFYWVRRIILGHVDHDVQVARYVHIAAGQAWGWYFAGMDMWRRSDEVEVVSERLEPPRV